MVLVAMPHLNNYDVVKAESHGPGLYHTSLQDSSWALSILNLPEEIAEYHVETGFIGPIGFLCLLYTIFCFNLYFTHIYIYIYMVVMGFCFFHYFARAGRFDPWRFWNYVPHADAGQNKQANRTKLGRNSRGKKYLKEVLKKKNISLTIQYLKLLTDNLASALQTLDYE